LTAAAGPRYLPCFDPTETFRYFFVAGSSHTMVGSPAAFSQEIDGDPDWVSVTP